jgi:UDP-N-acetyl-D-glucosamine dehydrogenase
MKVCIVGLGYVGLPIWLGFASSGMKAIGIDSDIKKIECLNNGKSYLDHIPTATVKDIITNCDVVASSDFSLISEADAIILCVPTPIDMHNQPDLTYVKNVLQEILPFLKKGQLLSLESTTYPGTSEELVIPKIEEAGFIIGEDFYVAYSPERENPGSLVKTEDIPKLIAGATNACLRRGLEVYSKLFKEMIPVESLRIAEMAKLLENIHRSINLGLINEFKIICDSMDIDPFDVIKAASSKPFGFVPYYPGPGWGGHCIPVDPYYLSWKAKEFGLNASFIELAGNMNKTVIEWLKNKIFKTLNKHSKSLKGSSILVLGLAYKPNVDDARESPSLDIFDWLYKSGANVRYSDDFFPNFPVTRKHGKIDLTSQKITNDLLKNQDLVILLTDHDYYDYDLILSDSSLIIDCRGRFVVDNKKVFRG